MQFSAFFALSFTLLLTSTLAAPVPAPVPAPADCRAAKAEGRLRECLNGSRGGSDSGPSGDDNRPGASDGGLTGSTRGWFGKSKGRKPRPAVSFNIPEYDMAKNGCNADELAAGRCKEITKANGETTMIRIDEGGNVVIAYTGCTGYIGFEPQGCTPV